MKKIGFIGMGNMGQALAEGFVKSGVVNTEDLYAFAPNFEKLAKNAERIGFKAIASVNKLVEECDSVFMACKPYRIESVLEQLGDEIKGKTLISIAAGWDFGKYSRYLPEDVNVQYIMPNTPVSVGAGTVLIEEKNSLRPEDRVQLIEMLESVGASVEIPSHLMDAAMAVSGCGPAFFDMVIEALGDGAVKNGIQRKTAYELACRTMIGAAKLMLESELHPGDLKDRVCSPAGTTIKGVAALEEAGVRSAFIKAVDAVVGK